MYMLCGLSVMLQTFSFHISYEDSLPSMVMLAQHSF